MKKIIALFALALLFVHCAEEPISSNKTEIKSFSVKKTSYKWPLFIPKNAVPANYAFVYDKVVCDSDSLYYYVDLSLENNVSNIINWLQANDQFIDYTASYPNIEMSHKIDVYSYPQVLWLSNSAFKALSLSQIKGAVKNAGASYGNHFQFFLSFSIGSLNVNVVPATYTQNGSCYSMPLFNSIIENNHLDGGSVDFEFAQATISNQNTLIFRVKNLEGNYMYYDFSNSPPIR